MPIDKGGFYRDDFGLVKQDPTQTHKKVPVKQDPLIGATIDGYQVLELVGEGGFSKVYKVCPLGLPKQYFALKYVPNKAHTPLLEAEAQILSELKHPNIPTPVRIGTFNGGSYLIMDFVPATLHELTKRGGPLELQQSLDIIEQLLQILDYAHQKGIYHRDLKPKNIGLALRERTDLRDTVYLLDFNIAKRLQVANPIAPAAVENSGLQSEIVQIGDVQKSLLGGTEGYQSPEQRKLSVNGKVAPVTAKSDIYTVGIVLYQMLMGHLPFGSYSKPSTQDRPKWIDDLIDKAMSPDPDERWGSAKEMLAAIEKGKRGELDRPKAPKVSILTKVKNLALTPFRFLSWLYCGGMVNTALIKDAEGLLAFFATIITICLWVITLCSPMIYYKVIRDQEFAQSLTTSNFSGNLFYIKNRSLAYSNARDLFKPNVNPQEIMCHRSIDHFAYLGSGTVVFQHDKTIWIASFKGSQPTTITKKQIFETKTALDNRYIQRLETFNGLIYFELTNGHWYSIDPDGKNIEEVFTVPAFKTRNVSPDGRYILNGSSLEWNRDRWGNAQTSVTGNDTIWVAEDF